MRKAWLMSVALLLAAGGAQAADQPWPFAGGDPGHQRFAPQTQIDTQSVARLGGAWTFSLGQGFSRGAPIVVDGVMYVASVPGELLAIDAATGKEIWRRKVEGGIAGANKGVSVGHGRLFVGLGDGKLGAFDAHTGEPLWATLLTDGPTSFGQFVPQAPALAGNLVINGVASGDSGMRGRVIALDAATGKEVWRFNTVPAAGDIGGDSWPKDGRRGGAAVWSTPAVDEAAGLLLFGTSNAAPTYGPETRPGDNLFSASIVAVDLKTGKYRWHFQLVHHEMWESDVAAAPLLYDAEIGGKKQKAVAVLRADGHLFLLDRLTGKPLTPVEERKVPVNPRLFSSPTQPYPVGADQIGSNCAEGDLIPKGFRAACYYEPVDFNQPNVYFPNNTRFAPMAFSPRHQRIFIAGGAGGFWYRRAEDPNFFVVPSAIPGLKSYGTLTAIDIKTNKIAWQQKRPWNLSFGTGFLATTDLVFTGEPDGTLTAFESATGKEVWKFQTGGALLGPLSSYEIGGVAYIAGVAGPNVWAFRLDGTVPPLPAPPRPPTENEFAGRVVSTDKVTLTTEIPSAVQSLEKASLKDEYMVSPARIRVAPGATVTWTNTGAETHEIIAADGSWTTGPIAPGATGSHTFAAAGKVLYTCKGHPWTYGQVNVEAK